MQQGKGMWLFDARTGTWTLVCGWSAGRRCIDDTIRTLR